MAHHPRVPTPAPAAVSDLVLLPVPSEKAIADALRQRMKGECIYTYISNVLVSCNPYTPLPLYTETMIQRYRTHHRHELPPHVFALAEETYRSMLQEEESQCIIISGESGAGKTEASKQIVQYIAAVSGHGDRMARVKRIMLESNPLLEAFGNAKTLRNDNSSRFGKFLEMYFDGRGGPTGGHVRTFLLEKSRVTHQQAGERNYHVFYQLCAGASEGQRSRYGLKTAADFRYLSMGGTLLRGSVSDEAEWRETVGALHAVGVTGERRESLVRLLAAVLHLGQVAFTPHGDGCRVTDPAPLHLACTLLGLDPSVGAQALTHKRVRVNAADILSPLTMEQCAGRRDALAKTVYAALFEWVVAQVNAAFTVEEGQRQLMIGVLDIYGFEVFQQNSFEQFCINYVNEKLQQIFIELTLKAEQEEYVRERITWAPIKFFNNKVVCDLCEARSPPGVFAVLDDVCATMAKEAGDTVDRKLLDKLDTYCGVHPHFQRYESGFQVRHYAGDVSYGVLGFVEKNRDTLGAELTALVRAGTDPLLAEMLAPLLPDDAVGSSPLRPPGPSGSSTGGARIRSQAAALVKTLTTCTPHYIRCIKPNDTRTPLLCDEQRVLHQVKYLGLLENIKVRRAGFAYRQHFDKFLKRFRYVCPLTFPRPFPGADKDGCRAILEAVPSLQGDQHYQLGETKVFLRHPETVFLLEALRDAAIAQLAARIQRVWRRHRARRTLLKQRRAAHRQFAAASKERRRQSMLQTYEGDHFGYRRHDGLRGIIEYVDPAAGTWSEYVAEGSGGRKYFHNAVTQETVWDTAPTVPAPTVHFCCQVQRITDHCTGQSAVEFCLLTDRHLFFIEESIPPPPPPPKPKPKPPASRKVTPVVEPAVPPAPSPICYVVRKRADVVLLRAISLSLLADPFAVLHTYGPSPRQRVQEADQRQGPTPEAERAH